VLDEAHAGSVPVAAFERDLVAAHCADHLNEQVRSGRAAHDTDPRFFVCSQHGLEGEQLVDQRVGGRLSLL
jgi:hypothetical protein